MKEAQKDIGLSAVTALMCKQVAEYICLKNQKKLTSKQSEVTAVLLALSARITPFLTHPTEAFSHSQVSKKLFSNTEIFALGLYHTSPTTTATSIPSHSVYLHYIHGLLNSYDNSTPTALHTFQSRLNSLILSDDGDGNTGERIGDNGVVVYQWEIHGMGEKDIDVYFEKKKGIKAKKGN